MVGSLQFTVDRLRRTGATSPVTRHKGGGPGLRDDRSMAWPDAIHPLAKRIYEYLEAITPDTVFYDAVYIRYINYTACHL